MWGLPNPPYRKKSAKKFLKGFLTLTISPIVTIHTNTTATVQLTNPNGVAGVLNGSEYVKAGQDHDNHTYSSPSP